MTPDELRASLNISGPERGLIRARAGAAGFDPEPIRVNSYEVRWTAGLKTIIQAHNFTMTYWEMKRILDLLDERAGRLPKPTP